MDPNSPSSAARMAGAPGMATAYRARAESLLAATRACAGRSGAGAPANHKRNLGQHDGFKPPRVKVT
jgi:hypothetical protein